MNLDKNKLLDRLEDQVEQHIDVAVKLFQNLPENFLLKPALNGGWSIAQCLEHLNSYGHYYLPAIERGLRKQKENHIDNSVNSSWFGRYFTQLMDPETGTKKFPAFKAHVPAKDLNPHSVVEEFITQQEGLLKYMEDGRKRNLNRVRIPISILKILRLNAADVFQFLVAHNERHIQQAKRNL